MININNFYVLISKIYQFLSPAVAKCFRLGPDIVIFVDISSCVHKDDRKDESRHQAKDQQGLEDRSAFHRILSFLRSDSGLSCFLSGNRLLDDLNLLFDDGLELNRRKLLVECTT